MKIPHRILFSQFPLAQLAAALAVGIVVANYFPVRLVFYLSACAIFTFATALLLLLYNSRASGLILLLAMLAPAPHFTR